MYLNSDFLRQHSVLFFLFKKKNLQIEEAARKTQSDFLAYKEKYSRSNKEVCVVELIDAYLIYDDDDDALQFLFYANVYYLLVPSHSPSSPETGTDSPLLLMVNGRALNSHTATRWLCLDLHLPSRIL